MIPNESGLYIFDKRRVSTRCEWVKGAHTVVKNCVVCKVPDVATRKQELEKELEVVDQVMWRSRTFKSPSYRTLYWLIENIIQKYNCTSDWLLFFSKRRLADFFSRRLIFAVPFMVLVNFPQNPWFKSRLTVNDKWESTVLKNHVENYLQRHRRRT